MEFGLDTFGDLAPHSIEKPEISFGQTIRDVISQAKLADTIGIDYFGIGEHHRSDFAFSAPDIALAAIASITERIKLGTSVSVLSSDDPVRIYERFATLAGVSNGRAEVTLGRGSFTESFPLFGYNLADYEELFTEKLELFSMLRNEKPVTWSGKLRAGLQNAEIYPKTEHGTVPTWIGVGGSPESVVRSVSYQIPMILAIIGGDPARFLPFAELYRQAQTQLDTEPMPLGMHSQGYVAATDEQAIEEFWPHFKKKRTKIGKERGFAPITEDSYLREIKTGALYVGSPETVAAKILKTATIFDLDRFTLLYGQGELSNTNLRECISLYGKEVIPIVKESLP